MEKLHLDLIPTRDYSDFTGHYGAIKILRNYCGLSFEKLSIPGTWQHGPYLLSIIGSEYLNLRPHFLTDQELHRYARRFWNFYVARDDMVSHLKSIGYKKVYSVGLPFLYLPENNEIEIKDSLLVFPGHSAKTGVKRDFKRYEKFFNSIKSDFTVIGCCLHNNDFTAENINFFRSVGFVNIYSGADEIDSNSLLRVKYLISKFEYIITDTFASTLVYAAFLKKKIAISGPNPFEENDLYNQIPGYKKDLTLFSKIIDMEVGQLMLNPDELKYATTAKKWADKVMGLECKRTPNELIDLFKLTEINQTYTYFLKFRLILSSYLNGYFHEIE